MTYLELEWRVEAMKTLGDLSLRGLEESLWEGNLIIEIKLRAIFSLSSQQMTLLWIDIWNSFWFSLRMYVSVLMNKLFLKKEQNGTVTELERENERL